MQMIKKTEEQWKRELSPEEYEILRRAGTERPFTGKYVNEKTPGMYTCRACGNELFHSDAKFDSKSGWPSFDDVVSQGNVELKTDKGLGMSRTEVLCSKCGSHLGHLFNDGPTEKGNRYCINSACLLLNKEK
jgi:methionine-R-sulfoxide reductase